MMPAMPNPVEPGDGAREESLFDAVLVPHRSLSPIGFLLVMSLIAAVSFTAGIVFLLQGAWPVFGFFGLDVALVYWAFRASYRSANQYETLRLTEDELAVRRISPSGRVESWSFQPYWLRIHMDEPPNHDSHLTLNSHGTSLVIGAFLPLEERLELADALRTALARQRALPLT